MRKDNSGIHEWCKHTRKYLGRRVNKANRKNVKTHIKKGNLDLVPIK